MTTTNRPVVIITFSDGIEGAHLQLLKDEKTALENTLWDLHAQEIIEIYKEESMSRQELIDLLPRFNHDRIILFHYAGHAGSSGIYTEGGESRAEGVAGLLGMEKSLQLVVLNGCSTMEQVKGLKERGVKAIVATSSPIGDEAAQIFATTFYKQLVRGRTLQDAFNYAIAATQTGKAIESHIQPMRAASFEDVDEVDEIPWDLYYDENYPEILEWTLPSPADPKENIDPDIYKSPEELQALSYPDKKKHLLKVLENDLNRIIPDLDALLASDSEHRETVRLLNAQLNDYFRNKYSRAVPQSHLEADKKRIKLGLNHLVSLLEAKDFAEQVQPPATREDSVQAPVENMKTGGIWRKVPPKMQVNKTTECKVKIAVDKSQLKQERAASDIKIRIDTVRTSNEMTVDLLEPPLSDSPNFDIKFTGAKSQLVDFSDPTEWTFYVTPRQTGKHKLLLNVTISDPGGDKDLVKVIPLEEEVEVVTQETTDLGVYEKAALLKYLPYAALLPMGQSPEQDPNQDQGPERPEQQPTQPETVPEPASATTSSAATATSSAAGAAGAGLGIGKILAGIVAVAAVAGVGWWATQSDAESTEMAQADPVQEEVLAAAPEEDDPSATARVAAPTAPPPEEDQSEAPEESSSEAVPSDTLEGDNYDVSPTDYEEEVNETPPPPPPAEVGDIAQAGPLIWMRDNLSTLTCADGSPIDPANYKQENGRILYNSVALDACNVCPPGWRLPTKADYLSLADSGYSPSELKDILNMNAQSFGGDYIHLDQARIYHGDFEIIAGGGNSFTVKGAPDRFHPVRCVTVPQ
jgi:hypothetical protein